MSIPSRCIISTTKLNELLVSWLGSDDVYENVLKLIDKYDDEGKATSDQVDSKSEPALSNDREIITIPPFYPLKTSNGVRRRVIHKQFETWDPPPITVNYSSEDESMKNSLTLTTDDSIPDTPNMACIRNQIFKMLQEAQLIPAIVSVDNNTHNNVIIPLEVFVRITKEICNFPSFFNGPLYQRIIQLWNNENSQKNPLTVVTLLTLEWYWKKEMEPFDPPERFFRLVKQPDDNCILRDDFLPFIKSLLQDHPGLEFLANHAEFQEKYAVTVITRIFYSVNKCHSGRITSRQIRRSDLLESFSLVDEEEDINKVTRYFSYEHFYVLYCRFWELDNDRDYRITREDLLKYGDHSLSHMIVDRIFDSAPRPFEPDKVDREYLSYEDFIYFMLSEEDKSNEVSVRYWFNCVDVDGDERLNNMEMRSFYAVQLHRMQCMGHEIVPFEDMLCQMIDMIKPGNPDYLVAEDFMQPESSQVSGALFDALFNLNKYLLFEQRDPFVERQKREDEFETDWDRFACIDYNRLAMEEEAREEEAMEIDWVTVDEDEEGGDPEYNETVSSEAPF